MKGGEIERDTNKDDAREDGGSWDVGAGEKLRREEGARGEPRRGKDSDDETTTYQVGRYLLDINQLRVLHYPWIQLVGKKTPSRGNYLAI